MNVFHEFVKSIVEIFKTSGFVDNDPRNDIMIGLVSSADKRN